MKMLLKKLILSFTVVTALFGCRTISAQTNPPTASTVRPTPVPLAARLSSIFAANLERKKEISVEERTEGYAKLLKGQRYLWRSSQPNAVKGDEVFARQAFQKAVEINPYLAEGYAVLAEISLTTPPVDIDETMALAKLAVRVQPENFSGHRLIAFIHTIKSGLNQSPSININQAEIAISEWEKVIELSPRFAEGWAFLSELYNKTNQNDKRIEALKKWQSSAQPNDTRFYRSVMGRQASLAPESVKLSLGAALIKASRNAEAIEVLGQAIADEPDNTDAVDLLAQAVESGDGKVSPATMQALQQAVFANPNNVALIELAAKVQSRGGQTESAIKSLLVSIAALQKSDKNSAAALQITLGDIYTGAGRHEEAVTAYEQAIQTLDITSATVDTEENREFAQRVFGKIIQAYKNSGKVNDAQKSIERARAMLGGEDLFADKQAISLLRETGKKQEALRNVRALRQKMGDDYSLLRLEAGLLTDLGKVDEAVKLVQTLIVNQTPEKLSNVKQKNNKSDAGTPQLPPSPYYDDFTNYIFISSLYNQAKRGNEAIEAARRAFAIAESEEKKQIADLSLATAQQTAGNFQSAEDILRNLLKKSPGNPVALNNLGYFLLERNENVDEAIVLIRQAVSIDPNNASYLDSLGWAYFRIGKLGEAELYLKEAARNNPASATVFEHLGDVYQKQQKFDLAKDSWQKALYVSSNPETVNRLREKLDNRRQK